MRENAHIKRDNEEFEGCIVGSGAPGVDVERKDIEKMFEKKFPESKFGDIIGQTPGYKNVLKNLLYLRQIMKSIG